MDNPDKEGGRQVLSFIDDMKIGKKQIGYLNMGTDIGKGMSLT
jgi:hypothetical protein